MPKKSIFGLKSWTPKGAGARKVASKSQKKMERKVDRRKVTHHIGVWKAKNQKY